MMDTYRDYLCVAYDDNGHELKRAVRRTFWAEGAEANFRALLSELLLLSDTARIAVTVVGEGH
jgi:hypothetical protein